MFPIKTLVFYVAFLAPVNGGSMKCDIKCEEIKCPSPVAPNYSCPKISCPSADINLKCSDVKTGDMNCPAIHIPPMSCPAVTCPNYQPPKYECQRLECRDIPPCRKCINHALQVIIMIVLLMGLGSVLVFLYKARKVDRSSADEPELEMARIQRRPKKATAENHYEN